MTLHIKRAIDIVGAIIGIVFLGPLVTVAAMAVWLTLGRPCLFFQSRGGRSGKVFSLFKLRTMTDERDRKGALLPDELRLTRLTRLIRASSLDEVPQLWNVLKGDMSLIGPRPWLASYLGRYDTWQNRRHEVRPGITGWAQIQGRNATSWPQRFELDIWYVDHWSLMLDLKILVITVWKVLKRDGISHREQTSMPEFEGTPRDRLPRGSNG